MSNLPERILESFHKENPHHPASIELLKDCFTIMRLEKELNDIGEGKLISAMPSLARRERTDEINSIKSKYGIE